MSSEFRVSLEHVSIIVFQLKLKANKVNVQFREKQQRNATMNFSKSPTNRNTNIQLQEGIEYMYMLHKYMWLCDMIWYGYANSTNVQTCVVCLHNIACIFINEILC